MGAGGERPTFAEIDCAALRANAVTARRLAGGRDVIAVVKADAYGHGSVTAAREFLASGCTQLAVISVSEAATLRAAGIEAPILVLGGVHDGTEAQRAVALGLTTVVHDAGAHAWLSEAARAAGAPTEVQVEVDTGMRRMGVPAGDAVGLLAQLDDDPDVHLAGVYTHLACADSEDSAPSLEQLAEFRAVLRAARDRGIAPAQVHAVNSAGLLAGSALADALPEANAVRPGLMLYGARPTARLPEGVHLAPVMTFRTRVAAVRHALPGDRVGYGGTHVVEQPCRIATLAAGYADGVAWSTANRAEVFLAGKRRRICGRVSMDYLTVAIPDGDADVSVGDESILFGLGCDATGERVGVPVEDAAETAGTLAYELLVRVGARVPRVVMGATEPGTAPG